MRLPLAIPASALLVAILATAWVRPPQSSTPSPKRLVARAGIGAIGAIVGAGHRQVEPEASLSPAPLTLASSRPDSVGPAPVSAVAALERYHERALKSARAKSALVITEDSARGTVKSFAVAEFEKKCEQSASAAAAVKKPKCTKAALEVPIVGYFLEQAAGVLIS